MGRKQHFMQMSVAFPTNPSGVIGGTLLSPQIADVIANLTGNHFAGAFLL
jgi:hypothetical protein